MQINHNISAMITQHALFNNNNAMGKSLEKLSTGLKINRAQDDAAGLAMSEQMRTQIRGLGKAKQNSQDGIAALQIAEGGLAEINNMLQRQRELAIQAANDTLTSTERKYLDLEFQELTKEITRIAKTTDYNGKNMLNWSEDPNLSFGAIGDKNKLKDELKYEIERMTGYHIGSMTDNAKDLIGDFSANPPIDPLDRGHLEVDANGNPVKYLNGVKVDGPGEPLYDPEEYARAEEHWVLGDINTISLSAPTAGHWDVATATWTPGAPNPGSTLGVALFWLNELEQTPNDIRNYKYIQDVYKKLKEAVDNIDIGFYGDGFVYPNPEPVEDPNNPGVWLDRFPPHNEEVHQFEVNGDPMDEPYGAGIALEDKLLAESLAERLKIIVYSNAKPEHDSMANLYMNMVRNDMTNAASYTLHIGPNYSSGMGDKYANEMTVTYISFNPGSLGLSTKNVKTQNNATECIDKLEDIIKEVSGVRAKIGTFISRLEYTNNNIANLEFNTQDAESRIRDTDFAQATTDFTRNQILVQSATSMLAQANSLPQTALSLIQ